MNYCETCAYWVECHYLAESRKIFRCTCQKINEEYDEFAYDDDALTYSYAEGGDFCTGPKFGCVHHEEKQK